MMIAILIAAIVAALVVFSFLCYKKAPPTQAIVVTGFGLSRPKVVCGRGVFVLPIVQRADRLNMRLLKIDVKTPETGVKTKEGVSLWLDSGAIFGPVGEGFQRFNVACPRATLTKALEQLETAVTNI